MWTPLCHGNRVTTPCFVTSTFRAVYNHVVFKLALVIILLLIAVSIAPDRKVRTYNGEDEMTKKTKNASPL
ncbi:hypothetical protein B9R42_27035 [Arthrospira platensis PCC 7345]